MIETKDDKGKRDASGAGIVVGIHENELYIITAYHVVKDVKVVEVRFASRPYERFQARVIRHDDQKLDLAVLQISGNSKQTLPDKNIPFALLSPLTEYMKPGDSVWAIGYGNGRNWDTTPQESPDRIEEVVAERFWFKSGFVSEGYSGGGVFRVVGDKTTLVGMLVKIAAPNADALRFSRILQTLRTTAWNIPLSIEGLPPPLSSRQEAFMSEVRRMVFVSNMFRREQATKEQPWENSLGMKFVPVAGTQVLFSIWDTRVKDFREFVDSARYDAKGIWSGPYFYRDLPTRFAWGERALTTWKEPGFEQGPCDPVVYVSWYDAKAFCEWLTQRERDSGVLPEEGMYYRLPTDEEWSIAVGLDSEPGNTPIQKSDAIKLYPWGEEWPPPPGVGNYSGEETNEVSEVFRGPFISGYKDGYPYTSPVGSFAANKNGLYDMGGNVWQLLEDWDDSHRNVVRGASFYTGGLNGLLASHRRTMTDPCDRDVGFRCVLVRESSQP